MLYKDLIGNIKKMRIKMGFTQRHVASVLGVKPTTMNDYEKARIKMPLDRVVELSKLYKCSLDELVNLETPEESVPQINNELFSLLNKRDIESYITSDPVVMVCLGLNEVERRVPIVQNILSMHTGMQEHYFKVELMKYLNSLMGIKGMEMRENLIQTDLSEVEAASIRRAYNTPYLGGGVSVYFPTDVLKRLLIWLLVVFSKDPYILKVCLHIGLNEDDYDFICRKVY